MRRARPLTREPGSKRRFAGAGMTGEELRTARVAAGVSQEALAAEAGYHPMYIGAMENGREKITARAARLLLLALVNLRKRTSSAPVQP